MIISFNYVETCRIVCADDYGNKERRNTSSSEISAKTISRWRILGPNLKDESEPCMCYVGVEGPCLH
jgi:hypothetical protein